MKWKLAAALVCTCTFGVGEAGEIVRLADPCWIHQGICRLDSEAILHSTDNATPYVVVGPST